jgi:putative SOS response-associated peptidase YedK
LVPANGFYEWKRDGKTKQPYCFEINDGELFAFGGLWDRWKDRAVHDRMPVILDKDSYDLWLDPGMQNVSAISEPLKPYDARLMRCYPVSTRINSVVNDDAECSAPAKLVEIQTLLF